MIAIRHKKSTDVILLRVPGDSLEEVNLADAYLPGANLAGCVCTGANFQDATLTGADLRGTDLRRASFQAAVLTGADLRGANLAEANLFGATLSNALFDEQTLWPEGFDAVAAGAVLFRRAG